MQQAHIKINGRIVSSHGPVYIIAEMSANHNKNFETAAAIIEEAKKAGADAIKLQTYTPDTMTINSDREYFRIGKGTIWEGKTLYQLYDEACAPWEWQPKLKKIAEDLGLDLFSSPFDETAVDFLDAMGVPAFKVASFELVDLPLIRYMAQKGKPMIVSSGMASLGEIQEAVQTIKNQGNDQIVLLKCVSAYPAPMEEMNLRTIPHLSQTFGVPSGLSDHTIGIMAPVAAVALGATVIEKHLTLSRKTPGPDSSFSLEPTEFKEMVDAIRNTEKALGKVSYELTEKQKASLVFRRSLFVTKKMKAGEVFTRENLRSIRPGSGLPPKYVDEIIGKTAGIDIDPGTPMEWSLIK